MSFSKAFSDEFYSDDDYLVCLDESFYLNPVPGQDIAEWGWVDLAVRPKCPPYSRLWSSFQYPVTPVGLFLWKDGRVKATRSWYAQESLNNASLSPNDPAYDGADDMILGGHLWYEWNSSWQVQVLRNAGYYLKPYEGPTE